MSSHHHLGPNAPTGEIDHINVLSDNIGVLYLDDEYSDIILLVDEERFHAHKVILAAKALLFGGLCESQQTEIELKDTSVTAFKNLLKYIYTGHMSLGTIKEDVVLDVLGLAHKYGFVDLEGSVSEYLRDTLQVRNACNVYDAARLYQLTSLLIVCCNFMERNAVDVLSHESFLHLSAESVKELLSRDSFYAPEMKIFCAITEWIKANPDVDTEDMMSVVRLPLISLSELLRVVRPSGLVTPDKILDAIHIRTQSRDSDLNYRGCLMPEENLAHPNYGTQVLQGEMRAALLDGDSSNYDMERGYTRHAISESGEHGILIRLGTQAIINHFKMLLWDKDLSVYGSEGLGTVIDHTKFYCRSWQYLYFPARVVQYIRIVGTNNTVNKVFHVVTFEAMFTPKIPDLEDGLVVPKENVATIERSASVVEGVSRSRNALLNGDTQNYDWDSGYTCHQLGSGSILVQLGQPYKIGSLRFLLWDCDERSYSYYIEVSANMWDWELIVDKARESCKSWQTLWFDPRPVVFVRIVGTHNTANEVFHCVHFECPAQCEDKNDVMKPSMLPAKENVPTDSSSEENSSAQQ